MAIPKVTKAVSIPKASKAESTELQEIVITTTEDEGTVILPSQHGIVCSATVSCPAPYVCSVIGLCVCPVGYYWSGRGDLCYAGEFELVSNFLPRTGSEADNFSISEFVC